jgi:hypothetical protein
VHPSPTTTSLPSPSTIKRVRARFFQRIRTGKY